MKHGLTLTLLSLALAACASTRDAEKQAALTDSARQTAAGLLKTLGGELKASMATGGPAMAIGVCKARAPQIAADAAEKTGFSIKRVSPKNRNPKAVPDAWETEAQASLEKRLAAGEKPETLDMSAVVDTPEGKVFRYAKALPTQAMCLNCHGDPDKLSPEVKDTLAAAYPDDKAVGYSVGMLRGILSMKKAM
jgi:hypothetical protein